MAVIKQNIYYGKNGPQRAFYGQESLTAMYYKPDAETDPQLVYFYSEGTPGLTYTKGDSENSLTIGDNKGFDFSGQGGALVTPAITYEYGDTNTIYKVTKMADHAFKGNTTLTSAVVDGNVTNIGDNAFNGCSNLKTITVGNSVETIANGGINNCGNLESIILGDNVREIGDWAFAFNATANFRQITIPDSVRQMGRNTFQGSYSLKEIKFTEYSNLKTIPAGMCYGNDGIQDVQMQLEKIYIPPSVTEIGANAFFNCPSLQEVYIRSLEYLANFCRINFGNAASNPLNNFIGRSVALKQGPEGHIETVTAIDTANVTSHPPDETLVVPVLFQHCYDINTLILRTQTVIEVKSVNGTDKTTKWNITDLNIYECKIGTYFEAGIFKSNFKHVDMEYGDVEVLKYQHWIAVDENGIKKDEVFVDYAGNQQKYVDFFNNNTAYKIMRVADSDVPYSL